MRIQKYLCKICAVLLLCALSVGIIHAQVTRTVFNKCRSEMPFVIGDSSFTESGDYDVVFSADSTLHLTLVVHENPKPQIMGDSTRCVNTYAMLRVDEVYAQYLWNDGTTRYFDKFVGSTAIIQVTDSCGCVGRDTANIVVYQLPVFSVAGAKDLCYGDSTTLATVGISPYMWKYEGATVYLRDSIVYKHRRNENSVTPIIVTAYNEHNCSFGDTIYIHGYRIDTTTKTVSLCPYEYPYNEGPYTIDSAGVYELHFTSSHGCDSVVVLTVQTKPIPEVAISGNTEFCAGSSTQLIAVGEGTIRWSTGETYSPITVSTPGRVILTITAENGCKGYDTVNVTHLSGPAISISGPTESCDGEQVTLIASGADSYQWSTGQTGPSITVSPAVTTTYIVTGTSQCSATASITVSVIARPILTISGDISFCTGKSTVLTASGAQSYVWKNYYNVTLSTSDTVEIIAGGVYIVTGTNGHSCSSSQMQVVTTKPLPSATILTDKDSPEICNGDSLRLIAGWAEGYQYLWNTLETTNRITVKNGGTYSVTVTAVNGCTSQTSIHVTKYDLPVITFSGNTSVCYGDTATITASSPNAVSYNWTNGMTGSSIRVSPLVDTRYEVRVVDNHACASSSATNLMVAELPVVTISGADSLCVGDSILLSSSGGFACIWNDEVTTPNRYVSQPGTYTVTHVNIWGCTASAAKNVWNYEVPTAEITGTPWFCSGNYTVLTAHGGERYKWSTESTDSIIIVRESGIYGVQLWDKHSCTAFDTISVYTRINPLVVIEGQRSVCEGDTATLYANAPTAVDYLWNTQSRDSMIRVSTTGTYTVIVADSFSCHGQAAIDFKVNALPECYIIGDSVICQGSLAHLEAVGSGITCLWSSGDTGRVLNVSPDTTTTYFLTVTDTNGCVNYASYTVRVKPIVPIYIEGPDGICTGDSALLVAHGSDSYQWSTGKIGDSLYVSVPGLYVVSSPETNGCAASASKLMVEFQLPEVYIEGPEKGCIGDTVTLHAVTNSPVTYYWSNGSTDSTAKVVSINAYRVIVADTNSCRNTAAKLVMFYAKPSVEVVAPTSVCRGDTVTIVAVSEDNVTYHWSTGQSDASISVSPSYNATYTVVASTEHECTSSASTSLSVVPKPYVSISGDTAICEGATSTLVATPAQSYIWSTGATSQSIEVNTAGDYSVLITNWLGCSNSAEVHVSVYTNPQPIIIGSNESCANDIVTLSAHGGDSYLWNTGSRDSTIQVSPSSTTLYSVVASNTHCDATATHAVTVHERPSVSIQSENTMCEGSTLPLNAIGTATFYVWSTGESTSSITVNNGGSYWVAAQNEYGCVDTARKTIVEYARPQVYIMGDTSFCEGSAIVLTALGMGSCVWNTGDTISTILVSQPGTYQVTITGVHGCTSTSSHTVVEHLSPVVTIVGNTHMCLYDTVTLTANYENTVSLYWNTGATTPTIQVSPVLTTNYSLIATSSDGCLTQVSHELAVHEAYEGDFEDEICIGNPYTGQGFNIPVQQEAGIFTYTQELQTVYGCDSIRILTLTVKDVPHIESDITGTSELTSAGNYIYMIEPVPTATSYEWIISNPYWALSFNETVAQLAVTSTGLGYMQVYALNACGQSSPKSMTIVYDNGVEDIESMQVKIYPNPADQWLMIESANESLSGEVWIVDMTGKIVAKQRIQGTSKIDVSALAAGTYTLRFMDGAKIFHAKFIKRK